MSKSRSRNVKRMKRLTSSGKSYRRSYKKQVKNLKKSYSLDALMTLLFVLLVVGSIAIASYAVFKWAASLFLGARYIILAFNAFILSYILWLQNILKQENYSFTWKIIKVSGKMKKNYKFMKNKRRLSSLK